MIAADLSDEDIPAGWSKVVLLARLRAEIPASERLTLEDVPTYGYRSHGRECLAKLLHEPGCEIAVKASDFGHGNKWMPCRGVVFPDWPVRRCSRHGGMPLAELRHMTPRELRDEVGRLRQQTVKHQLPPEDELRRIAERAAAAFDSAGRAYARRRSWRHRVAQHLRWAR